MSREGPPVQLMCMYNAYEKVDVYPKAFPKLMNGEDALGDSAGKAGSACSGVEDEDVFRQWLSKYGGYVHPSLRLTDSPSCQGRGWIACEDIDEATAATEPLIVIPFGLRLSSEDAAHALRQRCSKAWEAGLMEDMCGMDAQRKGVPLAIALAHERNRGAASPFAAYLRLLPEGVPSLWMKSEQEVADFMGVIGWQGERGDRVVEGAMRQHHSNKRLFERALEAGDAGEQLHVSVSDAMWALSHVQSRRHEDGSRGGSIKPGFCFLNHDPSSAPLFGLGKGNGIAEENHSSDTLQLLLSNRSGTPRTLHKGEELFTCYKASTSACSEADLEDRLIRWGFPLPQPDASQGDGAGSGQDANRLYDPDLYHLSSQQSTQLSSRLMDLVYTNPWHPLARKHLTTASAHSPAMSGRRHSGRHRQASFQRCRLQKLHIAQLCRVGFA